MLNMTAYERYLKTKKIKDITSETGKLRILLHSQWQSANRNTTRYIQRGYLIEKKTVDSRHMLECNTYWESLAISNLFEYTQTTIDILNQKLEKMEFQVHKVNTNA